MIFLAARERKLAKTRGNPVQTQQRPLQPARYSKYNTCIQSAQCGKRPSDVCFLLFASAPSCLSPGQYTNSATSLACESCRTYLALDEPHLFPGSFPPMRRSFLDSFPHVKLPATGMTGVAAQLSGSMSTRNSRQVSVRLSTAFHQLPSVPGSCSVSRLRCINDDRRHLCQHDR